MPETASAELLDTPEAGPRAIKGGVLRLGGHAVGALLTVASSAVVIRHLGVVDTGRFVTVMSLVTIVGSISDLGLSAFGVREYSVREGAAQRQLLRSLLGMRLAFALAGLSVAVAFAGVAGYTRAMVLGTVVAGLGMVLFVAQQSQAIPLHVRLRFGWVAALQLLLQAGVALGAVALSVSGASLLAFFALQLPVMVPVILLTAAVGGTETRTTPALDWAEWRLMLSRILPYSAAVILSVLYFRVAQIMVSLLSTDLQTGYFGVSFRVLESITLIPPLLVSSALPILSRAALNDSDRFAFAARRLAEVMVLVGVGLAVLLFLGAKVAVEVVAGHGFDPSVEVIQMLALALIGTFVISARGYALLALDRTRSIMVSNGAALAVVLAAGIPLTRAHGALGAAIALVAAELTLAACYEVALTARRRELGLGGLMFARVLLAGAIAVIPVELVGLQPVVAVMVGGVVYTVALLLLGALPADLRRDLFVRTAPADGRTP